MNRSAFTLVELLVVIVLMSILSGMMTYALSSANEDARAKRSRAEAKMMAQVLAARVNDIQLQAIELVESTASGTTTIPNFNNAPDRNRVLMLARREMARMTMPQCRADLLFPPTRLQYRQEISHRSGTVVVRYAKLRVPPQWNAMRRLAGMRTSPEIDLAYQTFASSSAEPTVDPTTDIVDLYLNDSDYWRAAGEIQDRDPESPTFGAWSLIPRADPTSANAWVDGDLVWTREHESAECLYLILATTDLFGQRAIDKIHARNIANTDGDSIPEIVDAWGQPVAFIREPVGLRHEALANFNASPDDAASATDYFPPTGEPYDILQADWRYQSFASAPTVTGPPAPTGVDPATWPPIEGRRPAALFPVIISAGPDGEFGIRLTYDRDRSPANFGSRHFSTAVTGIDTGDIKPEMAPTGGTYRYPDPFYDLELRNPSGASYPAHNTSYDLGPMLGNVARARFGGGLGGPIVLQSASQNRLGDATDNITSLDGVQ
ncbi:prepilin-type N-terminal cleavage/methylation domain-containing protein [Rhodopirellula sp. P2]|uniref:prepilin-type N-terminal cleavage/methylation domain-containing protein n=1 Tax=Rhodopirellula sp. P2 TaxID=2127060 RepID=UPI002367FC53|nr:prepilin-type N-terminal cleavage/methylation domain-containing protein [Rhodopirellula sp. P2]WDQ16568.1 prepilin-type N-terminal cleavage/methylation domain-containing protein [Rhodopirellula sp. P2]